MNMTEIFELLQTLEHPDPEFEWSSNNGVIGLARVTPEETKIQASYWVYPPKGIKIYTFSNSSGLKNKVTGTAEALAFLVNQFEKTHGRKLRLKFRNGIYRSLFVPFSNGEDESEYKGNLEDALKDLGIL